MRKQLFIAGIAMLLMTGTVHSQQYFELSKNYDGSKIFKGLITREDVEKDTSFKWYAPNTKGFTPNKKAVEALKQQKDSIQFITFMGTWCEDSHFIIPRFFLLLDAAGYPSSKITLIGVDRNKKTLDNLSESLNIINVPTIIVMKNGKEMGRVVEYGKSGMFDKELREIINAAK
ncbi:thioredoxin family protein [Terrimonas sp. NA20]|uniref:Thioredoxin family protein n=1 Tax=Terrimonas ginsenosidimutans TaxID=2908004 RepID=A0ABS9KQ55_9BACT|nr:thioredoxin family protein [Terrimonas ginsenosidimutans]MCG2614454.1 thioredoxin family protein [Terrimonas ginsenosidimutans]